MEQEPGSMLSFPHDSSTQATKAPRYENWGKLAGTSMFADCLIDVPHSDMIHLGVFPLLQI